LLQGAGGERRGGMAELIFAPHLAHGERGTPQGGYDRLRLIARPNDGGPILGRRPIAYAVPTDQAGGEDLLSLLQLGQDAPVLLRNEGLDLFLSIDRKSTRLNSS